MRKFVVSPIGLGGAVLAAGLAAAPVTAAPFSASAVMPQAAFMAPRTVTLAGVRYWYGDRYYYPAYCCHRSYYRRQNSYRSYNRRHYGYRPYYPGNYGYYAYDAPLTVCGTMLCYRPRYFIAPAW